MKDFKSHLSFLKDRTLRCEANSLIKILEPATKLNRNRLKSSRYLWSKILGLLLLQSIWKIKTNFWGQCRKHEAVNCTVPRNILMMESCFSKLLLQQKHYRCSGIRWNFEIFQNRYFAKQLLLTIVLNFKNLYKEQIRQVSTQHSSKTYM